MRGGFRKRISGSQYKYVGLYEFSHGEKMWQAYLPKSIGHKGCSYFDNERDAAIFVDKKFIEAGKEPINILKRK